MPSDEHRFASITIAERTEPEHGAGQAERIANGDKVELRLRGIERGAN